MSEESIYRSIEESWAACLGEAMPTAEEVARDPMVCLKIFYFAGASAALSIAYHHGFVGLRNDIRSAWDNP